MQLLLFHPPSDLSSPFDETYKVRPLLPKLLWLQALRRSSFRRIVTLSPVSSFT